MEVDNMNPCDKCTRVPNPDACDNKRCPDWQAWWIPRWEKNLSGHPAAAEQKGEQWHMST